MQSETAILGNQTRSALLGVSADAADARRLLDAAEPGLASMDPRDALRDHHVLGLIRKNLSPIHFVALPLFIGDVAAINIACGIGLGVVKLLNVPASHTIGLAPLLMCFPLIIGNWLAALYPGVGLHPVVEFRQLSRVTFTAFIALLVMAAAVGLSPAWYAFLIVTSGVHLALAPIARSTVRSFCRRREWWGYPAIIFGSGEAAAKVVGGLQSNPSYGLRPVVVLDVNGPSHDNHHVLGIPVLGTPRLAHTIVRRLKIDYALVALPDLSRTQLTRILERSTQGISHVLITSAISPFEPGLPSLWRDTRDLAGVAGVEVRNRLVQPLPKITKRIMDLALTIVGGSIILPVLLALGLIVKLTSKGPICFGSRRIGYNGKIFKAWKFRTMVPNAEAILKDYLAANPEAQKEWDREHKLKNDPRITKIGAFLRKTSLDELPQLWNVIKGEMSLVGPRPMLLEEVEKYGKTFRLYREMRPGITGLWQVSGRSETSYDERLGYVTYYVRNWSPWLDVHIICRTFAILATKEGAY